MMLTSLRLALLLSLATAPGRTHARTVSHPGALVAGPDSVHVLSKLREAASRAVQAIRRGDAQYFIANVDPKGITLGTDDPRESAQAFRTELHKRVGAYCALFGCSSSTGSLRSDLLSKRTAIRVRLSTEFVGTGEVDVVEAGPGDGANGSVLFSLIFVQRGGHWWLQQIEYT